MCLARLIFFGVHTPSFSVTKPIHPPFESRCRRGCARTTAKRASARPSPAAPSSTSPESTLARSAWGCACRPWRSTRPVAGKMPKQIKQEDIHYERDGIVTGSEKQTAVRWGPDRICFVACTCLCWRGGGGGGGIMRPCLCSDILSVLLFWLLGRVWLGGENVR